MLARGTCDDRPRRTPGRLRRAAEAAIGAQGEADRSRRSYALRVNRGTDRPLTTALGYAHLHHIARSMRGDVIVERLHVVDIGAINRKDHVARF